jgi:uncharacterized protein (TIGR02996 family)
MTRRSDTAPVSPDLLALLVGCKADSDDAQARLVLADWLEEHGQDERAELIRVQVPPPGQVLAVEQHNERQARAAELEQRHAAAWLGPLRKLVEHAWFHRGLLYVDIPASVFGSKAETKLAQWDGWPWVESITVSLTADNVEAAAASPLLQGVGEVGLDVDQEGDVNPAARFVASARLDTVRTLHLRDLRLGDAGAAALARNPSLANLTALDLYKNGLEDAGIAALAASPTLRNLRRLHLRSNWLTVTGATALARSPYLTRLVELDLGDMIVLGDKALTALAGSPNLAGVRHLVLCGNKIGNKGVAALAGSPHVAQLRSLVLTRNRIGAPGAAALAASRHLSGLGSLDLSDNEIGDRGVAALVASPHLTALWSLDVDGCGIGPRGLRGLPSGAAWRNLDRLILNTNRLGDAGVRFLAAAAPGALRRLDLRETEVGDPGAEALAHSPHVWRLAELDLAENQVGDAGAKALAEAPWTRLEYLNLRENAVGTPGARALLALARLPGPPHLYLGGNRLGRKVKADLRKAFGDRVALYP